MHICLIHVDSVLQQRLKPRKFKIQPLLCHFLLLNVKCVFLFFFFFKIKWTWTSEGPSSVWTMKFNGVSKHGKTYSSNSGHNFWYHITGCFLPVETNSPGLNCNNKCGDGYGTVWFFEIFFSFLTNIKFNYFLSTTEKKGKRPFVHGNLDKEFRWCMY